MELVKKKLLAGWCLCYSRWRDPPNFSGAPQIGSQFTNHVHIWYVHCFWLFLEILNYSSRLVLNSWKLTWFWFLTTIFNVSDQCNCKAFGSAISIFICQTSISLYLSQSKSLRGAFVRVLIHCKMNSVEKNLFPFLTKRKRNILFHLFLTYLGL